MEQHKKIVQECFRAVLHRELEDQDALHQAAASLIEGMQLSDFLTNLLHSPEYQSRIGQDAGFSRFTPVCAELDDRRLWLDLSDMAVSRVCLTGNYEPAETAFVRQNLAAGDTFIDIGANIGWFTTLAAQIVGATGHVHAFEPRDETRSLLLRSIADNDLTDRITVHDYALAAEAAATRLLWMGGTNNPGGSRLARDDSDAFDGMDGQDVSTRPLDEVDIAGRVTLVKLDVEGGEANVLRGARQFLARHRPVILTEVCEVALEHVSQVSLSGYVDLIASLGYRICALDRSAIGAVLEVEDLRADHPFNVVLVPD